MERPAFGCPDAAGHGLTSRSASSALPGADHSVTILSRDQALMVHLSEFYLPLFNWRVTLDFASHCRFTKATMINVQTNREDLLTDTALGSL